MNREPYQGVCVLGDSLDFSHVVAAEKTKVESVELVLPPHTNHQVADVLGSVDDQTLAELLFENRSTPLEDRSWPGW